MHVKKKGSSRNYCIKIHSRSNLITGKLNRICYFLIQESSSKKADLEHWLRHKRRKKKPHQRQLDEVKHFWIHLFFRNANRNLIIVFKFFFFGINRYAAVCHHRERLPDRVDGDAHVFTKRFSFWLRFSIHRFEQF